MYVLVGVRIAHYPGEKDEEERVALFETQEAAKAYEKAARLKSWSDWCSQGVTTHKQYRAKSLLSRFCYAYVDWYEEENLPVNPTIEVK